MEDVIKKYKDHLVDQDTQKRLNEPLKDESGFDEKHEKFLKMMIDKIEKEEIDVHDSKTLYNHDVYDKLNDNEQEKTDLNAVNIMSIIRQIHDLWQQSPEPTYQVQNLVETVFQMKSRFEEKYGDVYII